MSVLSLARIRSLWRRAAAWPGNGRCGHPALDGASLVGAVDLQIDPSATVECGPGVTFINCRITARAGARLRLDAGAIIDGASLTIGAGARCSIGRDVLIERVAPWPLDLVVADGELSIGAGSRVRAACVVHFGGRLTIGQRTFINEGGQIRCDDAVTIGDFTLVSYEVSIFDTNTHSTDWRVRHAAIAAAPPHRIAAEPRPDHAPVIIGSDCWIGQRAAILKGATVGDRAIVALSSVVTGAVPADHLARGNPATCRPLATPAAARRSVTIPASARAGEPLGHA